MCPGQLSLWSSRGLIVALFSACILILIMMQTMLNMEELGYLGAVEKISGAIWKRSPRIACLVTTGPLYHKTRATAVADTWGKRCDYLIFVTTKDGKNYPNLNLIYADTKENYRYSWGKVRPGLEHMYNNYLDKVDWVLKADDDTYVIMDNLRAFLEDKDPNEAVVYGQQTLTYSDEYKHLKDHTYLQGGAGYAISKKTMELLVEKGINNRSICLNEGDKHHEDQALALCWQNLGVRYGTAYDTTGHKFHADGPEFNFRQRESTFKYRMLKQKVGTGLKCCSELTITFHRTYPTEMYLMEMIFYKIKLAGRSKIDNLADLISEDQILDTPLAKISSRRLQKQLKRMKKKLNL